MKKRMAAALAAALAGSAGCDMMANRMTDQAAEEAETEAPALDPALAAHLPRGITVEVAIDGRELFPTCGVCHGMEGEGTQLGPSLRDAEWIHIDGGMEGIAAIIRSGVDSPREHPIPMPALGGGNFDEAQLEAVAAYTYLLGRSGAPVEPVDTAPAAAADTAAADTASPADPAAVDTSR